MMPEHHVWVFSGARGRLSGGVFRSIEVAEAWIARHGLSGMLTAYPLDEGCFDWAARHELIGEGLRKKAEDPDFVGSFTSAAQEHVHYENGARA